MINWKTYKLEELSERITSGGTPSTRKDEYYNGNIPWLKTQEVTFNRIYNTDTKITKEGLKNSSAKWIEENSIIVAMYGATAGRVAINKIPLTTNQACCNITIDKNKADYNFIYYNLQNRFEELFNMATGAAQQNLNSGMLRELEINLPSLSTQSEISSIPSSLDNKIELNLQMNQTLEEMAQAIFKEWFIDFNFPGSDGKLVNSIPKGWTKKSISEIASNVQYGFTQSSSAELIGPKFLRITDIQGGSVNWSDVPYCEISDSDLSKYKIKEHDIFIARTGASTGENIYVVNPPEAVFASYLIRVQFDKPSLACFVGKFIRREEYFNFISSIKGGSAQPNANAKQLTSIEINIPTMDLLDKFYEIVNPLNRKIVLNYQENECLSQLRDSLLPKLMTGKIEVKA